MASRSASPLSVLLGGAAMAATGGALASDVAFDEHPTHLVVLAAVVVAVAVLRRSVCRTGTVLPAVSAAIAVQPVLHLTSKIDRSHEVGLDHSDHVPHLLVSELPAAGVQVAVPLLALLAVGICAHLLRLVMDAVRRPLAIPSAPGAPPHVLVPIRARRIGSMLRWCGWVLQAARRGPPCAAEQVTT